MKRFCACLILCVILLSTGFIASDGYKDISVWYGAAVYINEKWLTPTDANGKPVEPFIYEGTLYMPVRAVVENMGGSIEWDGEYKSVNIMYEPPETDAPETEAPEYAFPFELRSDDGENRFLGKCVTNPDCKDSIFNEYGTYGEKSDGNYSALSFTGVYGYGDYSYWSTVATHPPLIIDNNGDIFGRLTHNGKIADGYTHGRLLDFLKENGQ